MTEYNAKKRAESVAYLKERGKYLLDNTSFVPTPSHLTNIKVTMKCQADTMSFPRRCHK